MTSITAFGLISTIVASVSIYLLVLHHRLTKRRFALDLALLTLQTQLFEDPNHPDIASQLDIYHTCLAEYNAHITKPSGRFMAALLAMEQETQPEDLFETYE